LSISTGTSRVVGLIEVDHQVSLLPAGFDALIGPIRPSADEHSPETLRISRRLEATTIRFEANLPQLFRQLEQELVVFHTVFSRAQNLN
jgi:hypothetical protein